ncbi:hypothetical protein ACMFMF_011191 [Clarireedia jacksonii]
MAQHTDGYWSNWPEPPSQTPFFRWFMKLQDSVLKGIDRRYYTSANKVLSGSEADRKLDIFLASTNTALPNNKHNWSNVLVIGEHKQNSTEDSSSKILLQLAGYTREVFGSQPARRSVPGFTICGSLMRLWVFDKSGLIKTIAGYILITEAELGLNTFIKHDEHSIYTDIYKTRIYLERKPIPSQKAIVYQGTACYRAKTEPSGKWRYIVKFTWLSDKRQQEGRLLNIAKERRVKGITE